jgi:hypothetical protein
MVVGGAGGASGAGMEVSVSLRPISAYAPYYAPKWRLRAGLIHGILGGHKRTSRGRVIMRGTIGKRQGYDQ